MQVAARNILWTNGGTGTEIVLRLTDATGLYVKLLFDAVPGATATVDWGDGTSRDEFASSDTKTLEHTYPKNGRYKIVCRNVKSVGLRINDSSAALAYAPAIISVTDYSGDLLAARSGAYRGCTNLESFIAPNATDCGQRPFYGCSALKEVVIGDCEIYYDAAFENCTSLERFEAKKSLVCWHQIWRGCTKIEELRLGDVDQFGNRVFENTPSLADVYITNRTAEQIRQTAASGNIVSGGSGAFPWGAAGTVRFHGTDGIVLGNGTIIS